MLYATPYGKRANNKDDFLEGFDDTAAIALDRIEEQGWLNCGVVVPDGFNGEIATSDKLVGMSVDYCRTLAASLFKGKYNAVKLVAFLDTDDSSFLALNNGTIDVLAGRRIEKVHDFEGFHFSTPYYYGNETAGADVSFFSLATREGEEYEMFSLLVNTVVVGTIHAVKIGVEKEESKEMPLMLMFGADAAWMMKDAISYSGSYDQLYRKNFGIIGEKDRGRNTLNDGGPQLHSFPGLSP